MGLLGKKTAPTVDTASIAPSEATLVNETSKEKPTETVEINVSQLLDQNELEKYLARSTTKQEGTIDRLMKPLKKNKQTDPTAAPSDPVKKIKMTRTEYLSYWARDEYGNYVGTEPEEAGREIWRRKLWAELYLPPPTKGLDVSGFTGSEARPRDFTGAQENWIGAA